ncbi:cytochrome b/b6 domain-containing protein [Undibacterium sp.]|uniref:cytochrome b/b6 domain-containing protein n=1 Tax=Undibacterium sp. TaxID=1914977 RepID=UPI0026009D96|nr:cytochrome b/b6 domain-containing protein [Undibacterium sp.]
MITPQKNSGLVWDMPLRLFHWSLALCFAGAWLTAESEIWKLWHISFGYSMGLLVGFRLIWGVLGTRYARFSEFVKGPSAVKAYLLSHLRGQAQQHVGHNPAGALAIIAILLSTVIIVVSGYLTYQEIGGEWLSEVHEVMASLLMAIVVLHIAAVVATSVIQKENLVRAMLTGKKKLADGAAIQQSRPVVALVLFAALMAVWWGVFR